MITIRNLTHSYNQDPVLQNINLTISDKDKVGVVGVNGSGKTTLLKIILGTLVPDSGRVIFSRTTRFVGYMPQVISEVGLPEGVSVFDFLLSGRPIREIEVRIKDLYDALADPAKRSQNKKILADLEKAQDEFMFWGGYKAENELLRIIEGMNIGSIDLDASISSLSGGQKSKVAFARLLYSRADILLLDEPTNHLDSKSQEWVRGFLKAYPKSVIVVSHDTSFLDSFANRIVRIDEFTHCAEAYQGNYSDYLMQFENARLSQKHLAEKQEREEGRLKAFISKMSGVSGKRKRTAKSREKTLEKLQKVKVVQQKDSKKARIQISPKRVSGSIPLKVESVCFGYSAKKKVIDDLTLSLNRNEKIVIIGENGAGKSTLLKLVYGKLKPLGGSIILDPKVDLGYYSQEQEDLNMDNTLIEEIRSVGDVTQSQARSFLGRFLFSGDKAFQKISTLSPGERSRIALAKLTLRGGNLLLLDEPTNHLDPVTCDIVADAFRDYGGTMIVVSHNTKFLEKLGVERMLILPAGKIDYYDKKTVDKYREEEE